MFYKTLESILEISVLVLFTFFVMLAFKMTIANPIEVNYAYAKSIKEYFDQDFDPRLMDCPPEEFTIGIIDTGIDYKNNTLKYYIWNNYQEKKDGLDNDGNGLVDDLIGWDFSRKNNNPYDTQGHGTHVAGIITGRETVICPKYKIIPLNFYNTHFRTDSIVNSLDYLSHLQKPPVLVNMSIGGQLSSYIERTAVKRARDKGIILVTADNNEIGRPHFPCDYALEFDNVVCVANYYKGEYLSSHGPATMFAANGYKILSFAPENKLVRASGSSMATPKVSKKLIELKIKNPTWGYKKLIAALCSSAARIPGVKCGYIK